MLTGPGLPSRKAPRASPTACSGQADRALARSGNLAAILFSWLAATLCGGHAQAGIDARRPHASAPAAPGADLTIGVKRGRYGRSFERSRAASARAQ